MQPESEQQTKSKGHLIFIDHYEYFERNDVVYVVDVQTKPVQRDGYRIGRFHTTKHLWPDYLKFLQTGT